MDEYSAQRRSNLPAGQRRWRRVVGGRHRHRPSRVNWTGSYHGWLFQHAGAERHIVRVPDERSLPTGPEIRRSPSLYPIVFRYLCADTVKYTCVGRELCDMLGRMQQVDSAEDLIPAAGSPSRVLRITFLIVPPATSKAYCLDLPRCGGGQIQICTLLGQ
jgi:hypothetical protein